MEKYDFERYNQFLNTQSPRAGWYRRYWLYPFLCRNLKGKTLDVGSGLGDFVIFRENTIGVDINPTNVQFVQSRGGRAVVMKENELPFDDDFFDSVNIDNVLEHLVDPNALLLEMQRVLKPNGLLLIGVPGRKGFKSAPDHEVYYSRNHLVDLLKDFKFDLRKFSYMPFKFDFFEDTLRQYCYYALFENKK